MLVTGKLIYTRGLTRSQLALWANAHARQLALRPPAFRLPRTNQAMEPGALVWVGGGARFAPELPSKR